MCRGKETSHWVVGMPELTAELLVLLALLEALRIKMDDPDKCRKHLVGRMRRLLGSPMPSNVSPIATSEHSEPLKRAQLGLASVCKVCGGCPMANE